MSSEAGPVFVWIWLPAATEPVVAGRLDPSGDRVAFTYGRSYLERDDAIAVFLPDLPLGPGPVYPAGELAGPIRDAGPDAWGRRVIEYGLGLDASAGGEAGVLDYLTRSGSDRIGALDFQAGATEYTPRASPARLEDLLTAAGAVEAGQTLPAALDLALLHASSVGGARPKALLEDDGRHLIAKFSSNSDPYPVVKAEFVAIELARRVGLDVPGAELVSVLGKDVLLVERFDRPGGGRRRLMVSALTILGLEEMAGRYATYPALADAIRARFSNPDRTLRELFARIIFNILVGNTDDHAKNHGAFWDGSVLTLTPAYDLTPQTRSGGEAAQAMAIGRDGFRLAQVAGAVKCHDVYHLSAGEARGLVEEQLSNINQAWEEVAEQARLTEVERGGLWHRQILNPFALEGYIPG
ncbi:MAG TPA: HipA domain-containing protein [Acidimicrobiales bacterium]|nr:HipA domain-containing protein [Acidimicrobiales bacterium]